MEFSHRPVLLAETIEALHIHPGGLYCDCTAGGGGHSAAILSRLGDKGRLVAVDRDPDAIAALQARFSGDGRVRIVHDTFDHVAEILRGERANGILADLGVSSHQLDCAERGFSFHRDAPLDMRMSKTGLSAADVVNTYSQEALRRLLWEYGEEKYAPAIARAIVRDREKQPILTTFMLVDTIKSALPGKAMRDAHPARRTFQAIRIEVNGELAMLEGALDAMFASLETGGVLAVITFHSLEDRLVKRQFAKFTEGCTCPKEFPVCVCGKKPRGKVTCRGTAAAPAELQENPRARSAKLRAIKKLRDRQTDD